jgi:hypothetical protein
MKDELEGGLEGGLERGLGLTLSLFFCILDSNCGGVAAG